MLGDDERTYSLSVIRERLKCNGDGEYSHHLEDQN